MEIAYFLGKSIFFIIPGMLSVMLIDYLNNKPENIEFRFLLKSILFSSLSYIFGNLILLLINLCPIFYCEITDITSILSKDTPQISTGSFIAAVCISVILAISTVSLVENNSIFKILHKVKLTKRLDNYDVWDSVFDSNAWVTVRDEVTKLSYSGYVNKYSDRHEIRELSMQDVSVYNKFGRKLYDVKELYICRNITEITIEKGDYENASRK